MMNVLDGRRRAVVDDQNMLAMISVENHVPVSGGPSIKRHSFVYLLHIMEVPRLAGSSLPMDEEDTWRSVPSIYNSGLSQHFPDHDDILPHGRELLDYLGIGPSSLTNSMMTSPALLFSVGRSPPVQGPLTLVSSLVQYLIILMGDLPLIFWLQRSPSSVIPKRSLIFAKVQAVFMFKMKW